MIPHQQFHTRAVRPFGEKKSVCFAIPLALLALVALSAITGRADTYLAVSTGGYWSDTNTWVVGGITPNSPPSGPDVALITNSGTYTVIMDTGIALTSVTVGGTSGTQTLTVLGDSEISADLVTLGPRAVLNLSGTNLLLTPILNQGTINILGGEPEFDWGMTSSGTVNVVKPARLMLEGVNVTYDFNPGHRFTGTGVWDLDGSISLNGVLSNVTLVANYEVTFNSYLLNGSLTWNYGPGNQWGTLTIATNSWFNLGTGTTLHGTITNYGTFIVPVDAQNDMEELWLRDNARIENISGALVDIQGDGDFYVPVAGPVFDNAGILRKSGGAGLFDLYASMAFNNTGLIDVQQGTLAFEGGLTSSGTNNVAPGAAIEWGGGTANILPANVFAGTGTCWISGDMAVNGALNGNLTYNVNASVAFNGRLDSVMWWTNGDLSGTLTIGTNAALNYVDSCSLYGVLTNWGRITWFPTCTWGWYWYAGGQVQNEPGALIDFQNPFRLELGTGMAFNNAGTLRKSLDTSTSIFSTALLFTNTGLLDIQSGGMEFFESLVSLGTINLATNTTLQLDGGFFSFGPAHVFTGSGTCEIGASTMTINGPLTGPVDFEMDYDCAFTNCQLNGTMNWTDGNLTGALAIGTNGVLNLASPGWVQGILTNFGRIVWPATGGIFWSFDDGTRLVNRPGGLIDLQTDGRFYSRGTQVFDNGGTLRKSGGTNESSFDAGFTITNHGVLEAQLGTLTINGTYAENANADLAVALGGPTLGVQYGNIQFANPTAFVGAFSVSTRNNYRPSGSDTLTVVGYPGYSGNFSAWDGLDLGNGATLLPHMGATALTLTVSNAPFTISTTSSPASAGTTTGAGTFPAASVATVIATPTNGFSFTNWTENGAVVSTSASYSFTLNGNRALVANFVPAPPNTFNITVSAAPSGEGTVSGSGTFPAGSSQTVTASPASGCVFADWTENGAVVSTSASYSFTVNGNRALVANFARGTFTPTAGTYNGLFYDVTNGVAQQSSGSFTITTTTKRKFSGNLQLGSVRYPLTGTLDTNGYASVPPGRQPNPVTVTFQMDLTPGSGRVTGSVAGHGWSAQLAGERVFSTHSFALQLHKYTMVFASPGGSAGYCYGTLSVSSLGKVSFAGALADGTKLTQSSALCENGQWPCYIPLYGGHGSVLSWLTFDPRSTNAVSGNLSWIKPSLPANLPAAQYYPGPFATNCDVFGSDYQQPQPGTGVLNFTDAQLVLSGADPGLSLTNYVSLNAGNNHVTCTNKAVKLTFTLSTGTFKGTVAGGKGTKPVTFNGVVLANRNVGCGGFLFGAQCGEVLLGAPDDLADAP